MPCGISIVKINYNGFNTYVTLGLNAYKMNVRSKDKQFTELVARSSENISAELEALLLEHMTTVIPSVCERGEFLGEFHTSTWINAEPQSSIYSGFLYLCAAEPFEIGSKNINFLVMVPMHSRELQWSWTPSSTDVFFRRDSYETSVRYTDQLLRQHEKCCPEESRFAIDFPRPSIDLAPKNLQNTNPFGISLEFARNFGGSLWNEIRSDLPSLASKASVSKEWKYKYDEDEDGYIITGYIGNSRKAVIPTEINGKKVLWFYYDTFSPNVQGLNSARIKEARSLLTEITIPAQYDSFSLDLDGCDCLKHITASPNIVKCSLSHIGPSLQLNEFDNGKYLGVEDNPYFALVSLKDYDNIYIHPDTKVLASCIFRETYENHLGYRCKTIYVPKEMIKFDYIGSFNKDIKIIAHQHSPAIKFAKKNKLKYEIMDI